MSSTTRFPSNLNAEVHCTPNNPFVICRPGARDCISAIRRLPTSHIHGVFRNPSRGDEGSRMYQKKTQKKQKTKNRADNRITMRPPYVSILKNFRYKSYSLNSSL